MNYLGHFILSYPDKDLLTGNFIADFVKGKKYRDYPEAIARGILMHRFIDEYTDTHAVSAACRALLRPSTGKLSGIAIDILYDHILAKNFFTYSPLSLPEFSASCYSILDTQIKFMNSSSASVFHYMKRNNWIAGYVNESGVRTTLKNMSRRLSFENNLEEAMSVYLHHQSFFDAQFSVFFKGLKDELSARQFEVLLD